MKDIFLSLLMAAVCLVAASACYSAEVYVDARLGSVIGGKFDDRDGNLPFNAEAGMSVDLTTIELIVPVTVSSDTAIGHRSNADLDGLLPDGGSERADEHVKSGLRLTIPTNGKIGLYAAASAGHYIHNRQDEGGDPYWLEAGVVYQADALEFRLGWLEERQMGGDYDLGSLGVGIRFNILEI